MAPGAKRAGARGLIDRSSPDRAVSAEDVFDDVPVTRVDLKGAKVGWTYRERPWKPPARPRRRWARPLARGLSHMLAVLMLACLVW